MCGDSIVGEKLFNFRLANTHTSDSVQIKIKDNAASSSGSWGLRTFRLFVVICY